MASFCAGINKIDQLVFAGQDSLNGQYFSFSSSPPPPPSHSSQSVLWSLYSLGLVSREPRLVINMIDKETWQEERRKGRLVRAIKFATLLLQRCNSATWLIGDWLVEWKEQVNKACLRLVWLKPMHFNGMWQGGEEIGISADKLKGFLGKGAIPNQGIPCDIDWNF